MLAQTFIILLVWERRPLLSRQAVKRAALAMCPGNGHDSRHTPGDSIPSARSMIAGKASSHVCGSWKFQIKCLAEKTTLYQAFRCPKCRRLTSKYATRRKELLSTTDVDVNTRACTKLRSFCTGRSRRLRPASSHEGSK